MHADIPNAKTTDLIQQSLALGRERDALTQAVQETASRYEALCEQCTAPGLGPFDQAEEAHRQLQDYKARLAAVVELKRAIDEEIAERDRLGSADEREQQAQKERHAAAQRVASAEKKIDAHGQARERMVAMRDSELQAAQAARVQLAAQAVGALPQEVRDLIGAAAADPAAQTADPGPADYRAQALDQAIARADEIGEQLQRDLEAARSDQQAAHQRWLIARSDAAEAKHAQAVAAYLPSLAAFRAAHELAHGWVPPMPDFGSHARESHGAAMVAARAEATADPDQGVVRRGLKRLAAAAGL